MRSFQDPVSQLMGLFAAGRFAEMEQQARSYLAQAPDGAILRELLGISLVAQSQHAKALPLLKEAARQAPNEPQFWENLGLCQRQLEKHADAQTSLRKALALRPGSVETLNALGSVLRSLDRFEEAEATFREALAAAPHHVGALFNLGKTMLEQNRPEDAEQHLRKAIVLQPFSSALHHELGHALGKQGRHEMAIASIRQAIALDPADPATYASLALALVANRQPDDAVRTARQFLELFGDPEEKISDANVSLLDSIAEVFFICEENEPALRLHKIIYRHAPTPLRALAATLAARRACDWQFAAALERAALSAAHVPWGKGNMAWAFAFLMLANASPRDQLEGARRLVTLMRPRNAGQERAAAVHRARDRVRIGYLSADFYDHPVGMLIAGVIQAHDRTQFEVVAYDSTVAPDDQIYRQRFKAAFDRRLPLAELTDHEVAQQIAGDTPDIVVDLSGWTAGTRTLALAFRPAPTQIQWLGYAGTVGAPWIDYIVADRVLIPSGDEANYSEKVIRLPHTFWPEDRDRKIAPVGDRKGAGLPEQALVYCSFNQAFKITPEVFAVWMKLLKNVEGSVLWLNEQKHGVGSVLTAHAVAYGIAPERLIYAPRVSTNAEHLARIGLADLALDCFPYGSHATAADMLRAGVPIVALKGETLASRVSASILQAAGLPDLICHDLEQYFDLAVHLARDRDALTALRTRIARQHDSMPLFDTVRFTRNLEAAYRAAVERQRKGLPPDHLDIRDAGSAG